MIDCKMQLGIKWVENVRICSFKSILIGFGARMSHIKYHNHCGLLNIGKQARFPCRFSQRVW